jgi:hypothetical protein
MFVSLRRESQAKGERHCKVQTNRPFGIKASKLLFRGRMSTNGALFEWIPGVPSLGSAMTFSYFMRLPLGPVEEDDDGVVDGVREDRSEEEAGLPKADRGGDAETENGNDRDGGMDGSEESRAAENA